MQIYVVRKGDNLWSIAKRFGTSISAIVQANQLFDENVLVVGQALIIPTPERQIVHIVRPGESLWSIARQYGTTVETLARDNNITSTSIILPGQRLIIGKPIIEVNGYLPQVGPRGQQVARNLSAFLTYLSIFSYHILENGDILPIEAQAAVNIGRSEHAAPLMVITNFSGRKFSSDLAHSVLSNPAAQERLITNVLYVMGTSGYKGLNIDFEYVYPKDRELYNKFLARVVSRLHPQGFLVSTALAPKETANQAGLLYEAHDYPVHGRLADFVVLMTYEWGFATGPPQAIAPINKVRRVLNYAVTAIPPKKILMGMPLYGRDWKLPFIKGKSIAKTVSPPDAIRIAAEHKADIQYSNISQAPFYHYYDNQGIQHEVWFEDARSMQAKYNLVREYGLRGVSYWELMSPFPQNWIVLESNFRVRKII
ncbi:MAG: LysM peptidoglycan-binding domain-containing protein [Ignavibacteriales bacterium]